MRVAYEKKYRHHVVLSLGWFITNIIFIANKIEELVQELRTLLEQEEENS